MKKEDNLSHYNKNLKPLARNLRNNMTKAEACLWKYVLRVGMMKGYTFRRQRPVDNYIADFMCLPLKLIIEADGLTHDTNEAITNDSKRQSKLEQMGYTVLRFTDREILKHIDTVRNEIELKIGELENQ